MINVQEPISIFEKKRKIQEMTPHTVTRNGKTTIIPCDATPKEVEQALKAVVFNKEVEIEEKVGNKKVVKKFKPNLQKFKDRITEFFECADLDDVENVMLHFERLANSDELKAKRLVVLEGFLKKVDDQRNGILNRMALIKGETPSQHVPSSTGQGRCPLRSDFLAQVDRGLDTATELARHYHVKKESVHRWAKALAIKSKGERNSHRYLTDEAYEQWKASSPKPLSMLEAGKQLLKDQARENEG